MIFRKFIAPLSASILALSAPTIAHADDHTAPEAENRDAALMEALSGVFAADPLTEEQEARIPAAITVVDKVFPEGTYRRMMDETMKPMMDSLFGSSSALPIGMIAQMMNIPADQVEGMGDTTIGEVMEIVDPAFEQRTSLTTNLTLELMDGIIDEVEPPLRAGLARAYAVKFSDAQLAELTAFFETDTGAYYAGESFLIFTDPQVMSAMQEMMPAMMQMMPELTQKMEAEMAALPEPRKYTDLSEAEKDKLAELLGMTREQLEENQGAFFSRDSMSE